LPFPARHSTGLPTGKATIIGLCFLTPGNGLREVAVSSFPPFRHPLSEVSGMTSLVPIIETGSNDIAFAH
jgi:hypothetical protein